MASQRQRQGVGNIKGHLPFFLYFFIYFKDKETNCDLVEAVPFGTILGLTITLLIREIIELGRLLHKLSVFVLTELRMTPAVQKIYGISERNLPLR